MVVTVLTLENISSLLCMTIRLPSQIFFSVCFESAILISVTLMFFFGTDARKWTPASHPTWAMAWTGQFRLLGIILHDFWHFPFFVLLIRIFHLGWLVIIYLPDCSGQPGLWTAVLCCTITQVNHTRHTKAAWVKKFREQYKDRKTMRDDDF